MPPSKGKKSSKPSATPPPFDRSPSSRTPSTSSRGGGGEEEDEETRLRTLLSAASAKFPSFISETAFIGRVIDVDSSSRYQGGEARVWVSEAAMVSSSLRPGFLVSVSLAASDSRYRDRVPLDGFSDGIAGHFGVESVSSESNGAGNYFAIATVFPSRKVMKSEVRLSQCLSCTMGFPSTGKGIFLYPLQSLTKDSDVNGKLNNSTHMDVYNVLLSKCEDLYLKLVHINAALTDHDERTYPRVSAESSHIVRPNGNTLSPRTPLSYLRKLSSPSPSPVSSSRHKESTSNLVTDFDLSAIRMWLMDKKINGMLKVYAARQLCGRYLLEGSFVSFSICGKACTFVVESAGRQVVDSSSHLSTYQGDSVWSPDETQISSSLESKDAVFIVGNKTKISLFESIPPNLECSVKENLLADKSTGEDFKKNIMNTLPKLGGLSKEVSILKEIIMFSLTRIDSLPRYKGVLLHGPPGTGKTSLASYCAHGAGANFFSINGPEVVSQYYGESEQALCEVFSSARRSAPAVVFIDELDAIAPARKDGGEELSLRMVATLLSLMDDITEIEGVLLIAATNRPDSIDPALRRPGRLDREIEIGVPSPGQRLEILATVLDEMYHSLSDYEIQSLAFATHGFVGADLVALCNEAAMFALRRYIACKRSSRLALDQYNRDQLPHSSGRSVSSQDNSFSFGGQLDSVSLSLSKMVLSPNHCSSGSENVLECNSTLGMIYPQDHVSLEDSMFKVSVEDFEKAKLKVRPSAMREVMLELPKVCWEDVGGQMEIKKQLIEAVQWPQMNPDAFRRIGIRPPRGLLLFGPPGCSKTLMARAVASEAKLNFLAVKGPELFSKWVGESEKAVRSLFAKARANSPSIIFFDEIDGLAVTRGQDNDGTSVADRVLSQLLVELDGLDQRAGVTVIAATNRPDKIDPALLRPGRFDRHLDVKPPNASDRQAIFHIHMRGMPCSGDVTARDLACLTEGYTGADIKLICREVALAALEESFETSEISMKHFKMAIGRVQPTDTGFYLKISEKFRRYVDTGEARDQ